MINEQLVQNDAVASEPKPQVGIDRFGEKGIDIGIRYWIPTRKYFQIKYEINQAIFIALQKANIQIPYPKQIIQLEKD